MNLFQYVKLAKIKVTIGKLLHTYYNYITEYWLKWCQNYAFNQYLEKDKSIMLLPWIPFPENR